MKTRIITGTILLLVLTPIFTIEVLLPAFFLVVFAFAGIASYEIMNLKKDEKTPVFITVIVIILTLITTAVAAIWMGQGLASKNYSNFFEEVSKYNFFPVLALAPFAVLGLFITTPKFNIDLLGRSIISIMYIGIAFASLITVRLMGNAFIIYLFLITILTDTFAYSFGSKFGKTQMSKNISPKKTWEGAIAGTVIATILAGSFALFFGITKKEITFNYLDRTLFTYFSGMNGKYYLQALIIIPVTLFASALGQIGDLVGSKIKRSYDVKDFGMIFPGHGGVIDRFDSALFVSMFLVITFMVIALIFPVPLGGLVTTP